MTNSYLDFFLRMRMPLLLFVALGAFAVTYFASRPERDGIGYTPDQPIAFSHKLHAGDMKIDCQYCHTGVEKTRFAGIPSASVCMNCHKIARADKPEILKLKDYYEQGKPIPWKRIHKVPDYAFFSHTSHVAKGIDCASCHGNVEVMEKVGQVNSFTMGACLDCHRTAPEKLTYIKNVKKGPENCWACHR